jgi:hypothetical protein
MPVEEQIATVLLLEKERLPFLVEATCCTVRPVKVLGDGSIRGLFTAVAPVAITEAVATARSMGATLTGVTTPADGLIQLATVERYAGDFVIIEIAEDHTGFHLFFDGALFFTRTVPHGVEDSNNERLDAIATETVRSIKYASATGRANEKNAAIRFGVITGGSAPVRVELSTRLTRMAGFSFQSYRPDVVKIVSPFNAIVDPGDLGVAIGAALDQDPSLLIRPPWRVPRFDQKISRNAVVAGIVFALLVGIVGGFYRRVMALDATIAQKRVELAQLTEAKEAFDQAAVLFGVAMDQQPQSPETPLYRPGGEPYRWTSLFTEIARITPPNVALTAWEADLASAQVETIDPVPYVDNNYRLTTRLTAIARGNESEKIAAISLFISKLSSSPLFTQVSLDQSHRSEHDDALIEFSISATTAAALGAMATQTDSQVPNDG